MTNDGTTIHYHASLLDFGEFRRAPRGPGSVRASFSTRYLVVFPKSSGEIRLAGKDPVVGSPAFSVLYNQNTPYTCRMIGGEAERTNFVELDRSLLVDILSTHDPRAADRGDDIFRVARAPIPTEAFMLQLGAERCAASDRADPLWIEEALYDALTRLLVPPVRAMSLVSRSERTRALRLNERQREYARWAEQVITERFRSRISVEDVSAKVGLSPFHMCRVFRRATGMTMHEYRSRLRLRYAAVALADDCAELADLSRAVGFCSQAHFTTAFLAAFSITPGDARARFRNGLRPAELVRNARI